MRKSIWPILSLWNIPIDLPISKKKQHTHLHDTQIIYTLFYSPILFYLFLWLHLCRKKIFAKAKGLTPDNHLPYTIKKIQKSPLQLFKNLTTWSISNIYTSSYVFFYDLFSHASKNLMPSFFFHNLKVFHFFKNQHTFFI